MGAAPEICWLSAFKLQGRLSRTKACGHRAARAKLQPSCNRHAAGPQVVCAWQQGFFCPHGKQQHPLMGRRPLYAAAVSSAALQPRRHHVWQGAAKHSVVPCRRMRPPIVPVDPIIFTRYLVVDVLDADLSCAHIPARQPAGGRALACISISTAMQTAWDNNGTSNTSTGLKLKNINIKAPLPPLLASTNKHLATIKNKDLTVRVVGVAPSPAAQPQVGHARQRKLAQVALLHPASDQRHGDVSLDAVDAHPGRHQRQDACHQVHKLVGGVVTVQTLLPEFVQAGAWSQGRVEQGWGGVEWAGLWMVQLAGTRDHTAVVAC